MKTDLLAKILGNCYPGLQRLAIQPGTVQRVTIAHDDWCDLLHDRGPCNCDPEIGSPEMIDMNTEGDA